jgi:hypothetical protein
VRLTLKITKTIQVPRSILEQADMQAIGEVACRLMIDRVKKRGLNRHEGAMPSYSKAYAERKAKAGLNTSYRDLTYTNEMWYSLRAYKPSKKSVTVGFTGGHGTLLAGIHNVKHEFFGLSPRDREGVVRILNARLQARLRTLRYTRSL